MTVGEIDSITSKRTENMTTNEARRLVELSINENRPSATDGGLVVLDQFTEEKSYGWIFYANTQRYVETGDIDYCAIGAGPIAFLKADNSIHLLSSGVAPEEAIEDFERKLST